MVCNQAVNDQKASADAAAAKATVFELQERLAEAEAALHATKEKEVRPRVLIRNALFALGWLKAITAQRERASQVFSRLTVWHHMQKASAHVHSTPGCPLKLLQLA